MTEQNVNERPAETLQPQIAEAFMTLQGKQPSLHSLTLCAKEKLCPHEKRCEYTACPDGEMDRESLLSALTELLKEYWHLSPDISLSAAARAGPAT